MQVSTANIFSSVKKSYLLPILLSSTLIAILISEVVSFYKLQNLQVQKELASSIHVLTRSDLDLAKIKYSGTISRLKNENNMLSTLYEYDYINNFTKKFNYRNELVKLESSIQTYEGSAENWFAKNDTNITTSSQHKRAFDESYIHLTKQLNNMVSKNINFEKQRFFVELGLAASLLLLLLISFFSTIRRLNTIQADLLLLQSSEGAVNGIFTTSDAEYIAKQLGRAAKGTATTAAATPPQRLDSVSGINNYKGFIHECGNKKSQNLGNFAALCVFSIDNLDNIEAQNSSELAEAVVKKIAFILSLYRQHHDVIGRLDHNKFAFFLSRADKAATLHECELIRQSVEEAGFKSENGAPVKITLSGGFVQKALTQNIEEVITKSSKVLTMSIKHGGNRIAQLRSKNP